MAYSGGGLLALTGGFPKSNCRFGTRLKRVRPAAARFFDDTCNS